jgi:hypothetical protein
LPTPYASHATSPGNAGALNDLRIGIVRESMLVLPDEKAPVPIATAAAAEIKAILGGKLGAALVESTDPAWQPDLEIEQMRPDFRTALARLVPVFMPDLLFRLTPDGEPLFKEFAAAIRPTEFAAGKTFGSGTLTPIDYCVELAEGRVAPPANLTSPRSRTRSWRCRSTHPQYLSRRAADWKGAKLRRRKRLRRAQSALQSLGR